MRTHKQGMPSFLMAGAEQSWTIIISKVQEAMPLFHVYMDFVPNYYGQKAKKATQLACRDTEKADH